MGAPLRGAKEILTTKDTKDTKGRIEPQRWDEEAGSSGVH